MQRFKLLIHKEASTSIWHYHQLRKQCPVVCRLYDRVNDKFVPLHDGPSAGPVLDFDGSYWFLLAEVEEDEVPLVYLTFGSAALPA